MVTSHLLLLFALLGAALAILARIALLLMQGASAAQARFGAQQETVDSQQDGIKWHEINVLPEVPRSAPAPRRRLWSGFKLPRIPWRPAPAGPTNAPILAVGRETLADPVDGTLFQAGEDILRCACGTSYHTHSGQWLGEKNGGKCVSCKRPGLLMPVAS